MYVCLWSNVSLQVGWKLEVCTKPSDDDGELDAVQMPKKVLVRYVWKVIVQVVLP